MWTCPKCAEEVDAGFEICWACGTAMDGTEDPEFLAADAAPAAPLKHHPDVYPDEFEAWTPIGVELVDDAIDGPMPTLVDCFQAENTIEAKFVADRLMEAGIPAIADEQDIGLNLGGWQPALWGCSPRVRIRAEDRAKAQAFVDEYIRRRDARRARASDSEGPEVLWPDEPPHD